MIADTEANFLAVERRRHRPVVRTVCFIGMSVLGLYILSGPLFMSSGSVTVLYSSSAMIAVIGLYLVVLNTDYYLRYWWIDIPFYVALFCGQISVNRAFFTVSEALGTTPQAIVLYNAVTFLITMIVGIGGSFLAFALAATTVVIICSVFAAQFSSDWTSLLVQLLPLYTALALSAWANYAIWSKSKEAWVAGRELEAEKARTERLLFNVLPEPVAERLRRGDTVADAFSEVSVIFVDLVGFSKLSRTLSPRHLVDVLNGFFMIADECADQFKIEKVKTIGDAYLAVAGATSVHTNCASDAIRFSQAVLAELEKRPKSIGIELQARIGVHTGAVVGGVIGSTRMAYDYWGDTVNLASRIQTAADPNTILASESTFYRAQNEVDFAPPRIELLKGIGETKVYPVIR